MSHSRRILLTDDSATVRAILRKALCDGGYEVIEAENGQIAVERAAVDHPELILMDVDMPVMTGFEAIEELRRSEATAIIPVLFLTARSEAEDMVNGLGLGAQDYVVKPCEPAVLLARVATALAVKDRQDDVRAELADAEAASTMDSLTGLGNRRFLEDLIDLLQADWALITAVMIDIDHFKAVNDTYGHQAGDEVLKVVAERLKDAVEHPAEVGRYGGEEFLVLVPNDNVEMGEVLAERARAAIEAEPVTLADGTEVAVTVSAGAASGSSDGLLRTIAAADGALYEAKEQGRNRVVSAAGAVGASA